MPSGRNVLTLSIVHLSERMTLDEIRPPAVPNSFSQSEAREAVSLRRSNVITQKNHIKGPVHGVQRFSLGLTLEVLSSRLMRRFGTPTLH